MKIRFRKIRMSIKNKIRLEDINLIIEEFQADGYVLTLRQLYYQLVSRAVIPNEQSEYAKLSRLLKEGRMSGIVDWKAIEDRLRVPHLPYAVDDIDQAIQDTIDQYRLRRQDDQPNYLEVWVEKDALSGVLKRVTEKYHIPIMVNRGYSSVSAMFDAFMRFVHGGAYKERPVKILYLGDYDPSGLDMLRDIQERIEEFQFGYNDGTDVENMQFEVIPIALTREQVEQYDPPPNPAKLTDPRAKEFIARHGNQSWEVDALKPNVLNNLLDNAIIKLIDINKFNDVLDREKTDIEKLKTIIAK